MSSGEQVSCAYLQTLKDLGISAQSWLNWKFNFNEGDHTNSRIININVNKINEFLFNKGVAVIPDFKEYQRGEITTIGRGGSDATAVALQNYLMQIHVKFLQM